MLPSTLAVIDDDREYAEYLSKFLEQRGVNVQVFFDSDEPHLTSVALADDGTVYTGSNGKALLYKLKQIGYGEYGAS